MKGIKLFVAVMAIAVFGVACESAQKNMSEGASLSDAAVSGARSTIQKVAKPIQFSYKSSEFNVNQKIAGVSADKFMKKTLSIITFLYNYISLVFS